MVKLKALKKVFGVRLSQEEIAALEDLSKLFGVTKQELVAYVISDLRDQYKIALEYPFERLLKIVNRMIKRFVSVRLVKIENGNIDEIKDVVKFKLLDLIAENLEPMREEYPSMVEKEYELDYEGEDRDWRANLSFTELSYLSLISERDSDAGIITYGLENIFERDMSPLVSIAFEVLSMKKLLDDVSSKRIKKDVLESLSKKERKRVAKIIVYANEDIKMTGTTMDFPINYEHANKG